MLPGPVHALFPDSVKGSIVRWRSIDPCRGFDFLALVRLGFTSIHISLLCCRRWSLFHRYRPPPAFYWHPQSLPCYFTSSPCTLAIYLEFDTQHPWFSLRSSNYPTR
ncbi:hypothetical protein K439DRAFT_494468 [Ramaria rubella]|nr:hypothetical protein K439DRAFT_494468 [Ramaria rubella]